MRRAWNGGQTTAADISTLNAMADFAPWGWPEDCPVGVEISPLKR
jgi:hypothetical protein